MKRTKPSSPSLLRGALAIAAFAALCLSLIAANAKTSKAEREAQAREAGIALQTQNNQALPPLAAVPDSGGNSNDNNKISAPKSRVQTLTFKQMGFLTPIKLRGIDGSMTLPFSIRADEVVISAKIKFDYSYSPSLLPELSHLQVLLNEEIASVIPLPKDKILQNSRELELDPRLFTDYNKLRFNLIGHYTYKCEDPMHSSLWLSLSNMGKLELTLAPLAQTNDLRLLPTPFFDKRDNSALTLPFVFAAKPSSAALKAAGVVSSWFGALATYRGSEFPVSVGALPPGNAVVILQSGESIAGLQGASQAEVAIQTHPQNPHAKLLIISGKDENELMRAARAIALDHTLLRGARVAVTKDSEPPPRKPYDAPAWVPTDKPAVFGTLARLEDLQVRGYFPDVIRVNFRVSPDLFTWRSAGVPMELKYRFTKLPNLKNSTINISVNRNFVQGISLADPGKKANPVDLLKLPVLEDGLALRKDVLFVPPYQVGERNQLQFHYYFDIIKEGECRDALPDNVQAAVDPESWIDFSSFPHYTAMPNLAFFANIGFPFTRLADLSETAVVLPEQPSPDEISTYLMLMGRMGDATGYPALRHLILTPAQIDKAANRDILIIGAGAGQPIMEKWADNIPLIQAKGERRVREPDVFRRVMRRWESEDVQTTPRPNGSLNLKGASDISAMMGFESPLGSKRSVVYLYADKAPDLQKIGAALRDPDLVQQIQGDISVFDDKNVSHAAVGETYYVGHLPFTHYLRWFFSNHPLAIGLIMLIISIILSTIAYRYLRKVADKRLGKNK